MESNEAQRQRRLRSLWGRQCIAARGNRVYVGGAFTTTAGSISASKVAYWIDSATPTWNPLDGSGGPADTHTVHALAIDGSGNVYAGGQIDGSTPLLKKWAPGSPGTWTTVSGLSSGRVYALAVQGDYLYVGGSFTLVGSTNVKGVAKMNLSTLALSVLPAEPWNSGALVSAIAHNGANQIYFGGNMTIPGNPPAYPSQRILCLVNGSWSATVPAGTGLAATVNDATPVGWGLAVDRYVGKVYVGGNFSQANGVSAINVAAWNDFEYIHITELGPFSGGTMNSAQAINMSAQVAGFAMGTWSGYSRYHAYRWQGGTMTELATPWSYSDYTYGFAINDSGHVAGSADQYGSGTYIRGVRWTPGGSPAYTVLNGETSWTTTEARAISNSGKLAGFGRNPNGYYHAVRWDENNTASDMGTLDPSTPSLKVSYAYGINSACKIVGRSDPDGSDSYHAFRTDGFESIELDDDLGTFPGGNYSLAMGISDFDEVVGGSKDSSGYTRAFLTKPGKRIDETGTADDAENLGVFTGGNASLAYSVNNRGMVVGYGHTDPLGYPHAFLYFRGKPPMIDLNTMVDSQSGWLLEDAYGISDDGKIVGAGRKSGNFRGFVLDPNK